MVPAWYRREIKEGDEGPDVRIVRRKLRLDPDGPYDKQVMELVRGKGSKRGTVTKEVAESLGEAAATAAGLCPTWFRRPLALWDQGEDVRSLRLALGLGGRDDRYDPDCEKAVRRLQSANRLETTGKVDEGLAIMIGEA